MDRRAGTHCRSGSEAWRRSRASCRKYRVPRPAHYWATSTALHRRPAPAIGGEGQRTRAESPASTEYHRDAGDAVGLAPPPDRAEVRRQPEAGTRSTEEVG